MDPGARQDQRLADALRPGFLLPDELGLAGRLRATLAFAANLAFTDPQGRAEGHWGEALERDESFVLADIAAYPAEREREAFLRALAGPADPGDLAPRLWALVAKVDHWRGLLASCDGAEALAQARDLDLEIEARLRAPVQACLQLRGGPLPLPPDGLPLGPAWGGPPDPAVATAAEARQRLRHAALALFQSLEDMKGPAQARLPASLGGGRHEPALGLLLAFLRLHGEAQEPLNRFTERLTDFYYRDILGMRPRPAALERAHLVLEVEPTHLWPVFIEKGQRFSGGKDPRGAADIEFSADEPRALANARVTALSTLRVEKDPLISPEWELGFASRVKAERLDPKAPGSVPGETEAPWRPLFGGSSAAGPAPDARLGFAVSSRIFELKEGERELRLAVHLARPEDRDPGLRELLKSPHAARNRDWLTAVFERHTALDPDPGDPPAGLAQGALERAAAPASDPTLRFLAARCLGQDPPERLRRRLGMLFTAWLTDPSGGLPPEDLEAVRAHARGVLAPKSADLEPNDPLHFVFGSGPPERTLLFDRVFRGLWKAKLSTASGWMPLDEVFCRPREPAPDEPSPGGCVELLLRLGADRPALAPCDPAVHGPRWPAQATLQLELQTHTLLFGYSLLRRLEWREIELSVSVRGLRDLQIHNQMGRLDPGKPFQPFGPLPEAGSYLVLGSPEMASKPLRALTVRLEWGRLPREAGGFERRYEGYPGSWEHGRFLVGTGVLRDGQWQAGQGGPLRLFQDADGGRSLAACSLQLDPLDLRRHYRPEPGAGTDFEYGARARNGFFRFELAQPAEAFGHALYGRLLTETLTRNARLKRQDPLPSEPYTPVAQWIQADYEAALSLRPDAPPAEAGAGGPPGPRFFFLHPFGEEEPRPRRHLGRSFLLPRVERHGNLYIGLEAREAPGPLSLFFDLRGENADEPAEGPRPAVHWSLWGRDGWLDVPQNRVLSDGTLGFLRPGCVVLDLPEGAERGGPGLDAALFWLRLGANEGLRGFAGLRGVHANGLRVTRTRAPEGLEPSVPLPAGSIRAPLRAVAGLRRVTQAGPSFGQRPADSRERLLARSAERLRHKSRAGTAWDYERLLLDAFPSLFKVKAFTPRDAPGRAAPADRPLPPGRVLVAVVPFPPERDDPLAAPRFDAAALEEMAERLRAAAPPGADVQVRNTAYERVQVRCVARLARGEHPGEGLRRLNGAVRRLLSPWSPQGLSPGFGWELRAEDVEARLRALDGVESVGGLSLLHYAGTGPDFHLLKDSARPDGDGTKAEPLLPWSLLLPAPRHLIELDPGRDPSRTPPRPTGFDRLEVGSTFIISRPNHDQ